MIAKDVTAETETTVIEWVPVAQTMMEQLFDAEQAEVRSSVARIARHFDPAQVERIAPGRQGQRPFYVLRASAALRVFFTLAQDSVRMLDVIGADQLAYLRAMPDPWPRNRSFVQPRSSSRKRETCATNLLCGHDGARAASAVSA